MVKFIFLWAKLYFRGQIVTQLNKIYFYGQMLRLEVVVFKIENSRDVFLAALLATSHLPLTPQTLICLLTDLNI